MLQITNPMPNYLLMRYACQVCGDRAWLIKLKQGAKNKIK